MMMENRMMTGNRVDCLYRVSTDKQVDYNDKSQADIPMQRRECHRFCEKMGWTIVHEEQEDGVSGHAGRLKRSVRRYYLMGRYVRQRQHGVKENDRELPDPACGGVSGLSAAYRLQH